MNLLSWLHLAIVIARLLPDPPLSIYTLLVLRVLFLLVVVLLVAFYLQFVATSSLLKDNPDLKYKHQVVALFLQVILTFYHGSLYQGVLLSIILHVTAQPHWQHSTIRKIFVVGLFGAASVADWTLWLPYLLFAQFGGYSSDLLLPLFLQSMNFGKGLALSLASLCLGISFNKQHALTRKFSQLIKISVCAILVERHLLVVDWASDFDAVVLDLKAFALMLLTVTNLVESMQNKVRLIRQLQRGEAIFSPSLQLILLNLRESYSYYYAIYTQGSRKALAVLVALSCLKFDWLALVLLVAYNKELEFILRVSSYGFSFSIVTAFFSSWSDGIFQLQQCLAGTVYADDQIQMLFLQRYLLHHWLALLMLSFLSQTPFWTSQGISRLLLQLNLALLVLYRLLVGQRVEHFGLHQMLFVLVNKKLGVGIETLIKAVQGVFL